MYNKYLLTERSHARKVRDSWGLSSIASWHCHYQAACIDKKYNIGTGESGKVDWVTTGMLRSPVHLG